MVNNDFFMSLLFLVYTKILIDCKDMKKSRNEQTFRDFFNKTSKELLLLQYLLAVDDVYTV